MKKLPVILDLETKHTFREFSDTRKLGISVVGLYDYRDQQKKVFEEKELSKLFTLLESTSYIIGFNVRSFDMEVLQGYYPGKIQHFTVFDLLDDLKSKIGRRLSLNDFIFATLGKKKTGHGLQAIELYKEGRWDELKKYCLDDVMLTKELFDYGIQKGEISYLNEKGKVTVEVEWKKYLEDSGKEETHLTLPF